MKLTLESPRNRESTLTRILLPEGTLEADVYELTRPEAPAGPIPAERDPDGKSISLFVPAMEKGRPVTFDVTPVKDKRVAPGIRTESEGKSVKVSLEGSPFLEFHNGKDYPKPVINPVLTPGGENMLREPMPAYGEGEHPWQRGITLMQGSINGIDCWNEGKGPKFGYTVQDSMDVTQGPLSLLIRSENTWYSEEKPLMTDTRSYRLFDTPREAAVLDIAITVRASHGDLTIGGTKEAGFLCIRVNPTMNADKDGNMENCYGATDERACWSLPAHWVDYWGPVENEIVGFAVFDNPANFRYPTTWHVRGYGLFAPNCWMFNPDHHLKSGEAMTFQWRVIVHTGNTQQAMIRERFLDYVDGPRATWE